MPEATARPFGSLLTAMVTPMRDDGSIDLDSAASLAAHLVDHGHDGVVLNGTTGEAPTTHAQEKAELIHTVVDAIGGRALVVAGAGSNDTQHAVRMAEHAADAGAHGLLVVSPYYSRPSQEGIYQHTLAVADATDLPVMLYDVPGRTGVRYSLATLRRLGAHARVVAVKDATGDVQAATRVIAETDLAYYSGDDGLLLPFLAVGAVGLVSMAGHLVGDELAQTIREFGGGDTATARATFLSALPAIDLVCGSGNGALRSKLALSLLGLIPTPTMRLPQAAADEGEVREVRAGLVAAGLLRPTEDRGRHESAWHR
jgi:4-hydroxy-tetrahydrodipicolinate synthase